MPFYEYQCKSCGHTLEAMQKINDAPLRKCPDCGKSQLTRLMSAPVFRLKGGGWYETDFKGDQDNKKNLADRPEADAVKEDKKPTVEAKAGESGTKEAVKSTEKAADKPAAAEKASPAETAKKPAAAPISKRGASTAVKPKSVVKKPQKKAAAGKVAVSRRLRFPLPAAVLRP